jgi:hypothetical protein
VFLQGHVPVKAVYVAIGSSVPTRECCIHEHLRKITANEVTCQVHLIPVPIPEYFKCVTGTT